jgi:hypothetical protein
MSENPLSNEWKKYITGDIQSFVDLLKCEYPDFADYIYFEPDKIDGVFSFYTETVFPKLQNYRRLHEDGSGRLDRHKILAGYAISFLVSKNICLRFDGRRLLNEKGDIKVPFIVSSPLESFLANFLPAYIFGFLTADSSYSFKTNIPGYNIYYPDQIFEYAASPDNGKQDYNSYYDNFVNLLVLLRTELNDFYKKDEPDNPPYPLASVTLTIANALFLVEAVSDCGNFNLCDRYYKK